VEGMGKHIEIALIQAPTGVVDTETTDRGDRLSLDRFPPASLDDTEQGGSKTKIGHAACVIRPNRKRRVVAERLYFCLKFGGEPFEKIPFSVYLLHRCSPKANIFGFSLAAGLP